VSLPFASYYLINSIKAIICHAANAAHSTWDERENTYLVGAFFKEETTHFIKQNHRSHPKSMGKSTEQRGRDARPRTLAERSPIKKKKKKS
jgi:hypothetical protein